ncbi:Acetyl-CoA carboxylase (ACC-alpha) [Includes: Biotin carboxylase] [Durusdinium trenchii]|uniref:Acetyl-CoA carboxylase (ACC-alpha) n=1 Tax=Durusdinium trenchii TaxID=1381693 RepID=A0ABP0N2I7_9DINO
MASIDKRPSLNCLRLRGPCDPTSKHNPGHEHLCAGSGFTASRFGQAEVNNYANVDLICKIAQAQKVDAVWPGWGHASENPKLPAKLKKDLGIHFIGPTSPVMPLGRAAETFIRCALRVRPGRQDRCWDPGADRTGSKGRSKTRERVGGRGPLVRRQDGPALGLESSVWLGTEDWSRKLCSMRTVAMAGKAGVPSIPWSGDGLTAELTAEGTIPEETFKKACLTSVQQAVACAERIGFPVMLKASEGGGGKGIRMSQDPRETSSDGQTRRSEVPGSPVFMMQLCTGARHIEVQIVGDQPPGSIGNWHGQVVALSGRDCSTQRRFQKIFEEGPPVIAAGAVFVHGRFSAHPPGCCSRFSGAGTIEYLYNATTNQFYFLELNPRLQVEHPVTEAITGVNLPATQLQVAMGIPLDRMPQVRSFYGVLGGKRMNTLAFTVVGCAFWWMMCLFVFLCRDCTGQENKGVNGESSTSQ